jgi:hypothetical protein
MHTTVRGGKSTHRWAFDQGGGGYQGMEVNADPQLTNGAGGGGQGSPGASGGGGWEDEFRELCQLIQTAMSPEDATQAEGLLHRLFLNGESANAMGGEAMPVGRPTPVTQDTPPGFPGVPRTGARDGYRTTQRPPASQDAYAYQTMRPQAADGRPRRLLTWERDRPEIMHRLQAQDSARKRHESEAFLRRWPELKRIRHL